MLGSRSLALLKERGDRIVNRDENVFHVSKNDKCKVLYCSIDE